MIPEYLGIKNDVCYFDFGQDIIIGFPKESCSEDSEPDGGKDDTKSY